MTFCPIFFITLIYCLTPNSKKVSDRTFVVLHKEFLQSCNSPSFICKEELSLNLTDNSCYRKEEWFEKKNDKMFVGLVVYCHRVHENKVRFFSYFLFHLSPVSYDEFLCNIIFCISYKNYL